MTSVVLDKLFATMFLFTDLLLVCTLADTATIESSKSMDAGSHCGLSFLGTRNHGEISNKLRLGE